MYLDCNERQSTCTRSGRNPTKGCPNCEFTILRKHLIDDLEVEMAHTQGATHEGSHKWTPQRMLDIVTEIAYFSFSTKGTGRNWTIVITTLVSVYRDEAAKLKARQNWAIRQSAAPKATAPVDTDIGDFD